MVTRASRLRGVGRTVARMGDADSTIVSDLFSRKPRGALVAPSILSADFARMGEECRGVMRLGADLLHLDVMDGHFVPNLTMGPDLCRSLARALPGVFLDVHLMVTDPGRFVESFGKAGAHHLTFHVEAVPERDAQSLSAEIRGRGMGVGVAINPPTPWEAVVPYLGIADLVLVMSVNPGYSGQAFIESTLEKTRAIKPRLRDSQRLEMDGGISARNAAAVRAAGCDVIVAASAIFGVEVSARKDVISELRG